MYGVWYKMNIVVRNNNSRLLAFITGSHNGKEQIKILGYNLIYALIYGVIYLLLSTRYMVIWHIMGVWNKNV